MPASSIDLNLRWRIPGTGSWYNNCRELWSEILTYVRRNDITIVMIGRAQLELFGR
jgi:hypothetical protein